MNIYIKTSLLVAIASFSLFLQSCSSDESNPDLIKSDEALYINEISANDSPDWLELYNPSSVEVNLDGYKIYDDVDNQYRLGADISIPAGGFKVLFCDDLAEGDHTNFKLSANGETVTFVSPDNKLIDEVQFPAMSKGEVYARSQDGGDIWVLTTSPTQGTKNISDIELRILNVTQSPQVVLPGNEITITAQIQGVDFSEINLFYTIQEQTEKQLSMDLIADQTYSAKIPSQASSAIISYHIVMTGKNGQSITAPAVNESYKIVISTNALPSLFINEFMAINATCCPDTDDALPQYDDWIEIYNASSQPINIAGYYITDSSEDPFGYQIPSTNASKTTVPAKGFLLLWADEESDQGANHVNIKLSGDGEHIGLHYIDGRTIDEYTFGAQEADISTGRSIDGEGTWIKMPTPTPKKYNQ